MSTPDEVVLHITQGLRFWVVILENAEDLIK